MSQLLKPGMTIDEAERRLIELTLRAEPNKIRAAVLLGVSTKTLYNKLHRYGFFKRAES